MKGPGLVEYLQAEALDLSVPVSALLRRVKVAAVKLQLADTVIWADSELKGYTEDVPDYRVVWGRSMARDEFGRWVPIGGPDKVLEALRKRVLGQSVSSLEETITSAQHELMVPYPPRIISALQIDCIEAALFISKSNLVAIIDHVRNLVLDWALDLERVGITGAGLTFTMNERKVASSSPINIQIDGSNARLNIGSEDGSMNLSGLV